MLAHLGFTSTTGSPKEVLAHGEIHDAARNGDLGTVEALLKDNRQLVFSQDKDGMTPLHYAAAGGYKEVAKSLLVNKADVNAKNHDGMTPLLEAAAFGYKDIVELLLNNKADVNSKGQQRLDTATCGGSY